MNIHQERVANELLKYLLENRGYSSLDDYPAHLQKQLHNQIDIELVKRQLIDTGVMYENDPGYMLTLTAEGYKIAQMGYTNYLRNSEKKEKDKEAKDHRDAVMSKWQIISFWPMFIYATIGTTLGIIAFFWQLPLHIK